MDLFNLPKKYVFIKNFDANKIIDNNTFYNISIKIKAIKNLPLKRILIIGDCCLKNDLKIENNKDLISFKIIHSTKIKRLLKTNLNINGNIKIDEDGNYFCFFPKINFLEEGLLPIYSKKPKLLELKKSNSILFNSLKKIHFPTTIENINLGLRELFSYELGFIYNILKEIKKNKIPNLKNVSYKIPFKLNTSQEKAVEEIYFNLEKKETFYHLLLGDVGSGKTIVGFLAAIKVWCNEKNVVVLTPSVLLSNQIFENYSIWSKMSNLNIPISLVTNQTDLKKEDGIFIGTHALLYKKIKNIGLLIIDEQHKFGIEQRNKLVGNCDILMMSATPIPRTYQMMLENFISVSILDGKEKQQTTKVISEEKKEFLLEKVIEFSKKNKIIWICKTISQLKKLYENIQNKTSVFFLNSKIKEKDEILKTFNNSSGSILLSTTVIEVGIDLQGVNTIVIENADEFGLAQLHQLRGRVGRRENEKSVCILLGKNLEKLNDFTLQKDNIELSNLDLNQRGSGGLFEKSQSGFKYFKFSKQLDENLILIDSNLKNYVNPFLLPEPDLVFIQKVIDYDFLSLFY